MQNPEHKQIRLTDEGVILFQTDPTNPLPGAPVARIKKGWGLLEPDVEPVIDGIGDEGMEKLRAWVKHHIFTVLETLMPLASETDPEGPARDIARKLHNAMGIIPRADIESDIAKLDEAGRALLRQKKVRMGPVLIFLPALNKPAAVRLRALLWSLWNEKPLPAPVPKDGTTSAVITGESADPVYYRAIGYPLYAGRAIRVDMLDRLICAIYDNAKDGKFQAQHKMAEWLGCSVPNLYLVLEAMGHKKIHDPAEAPKPEESKTEEVKAEPAEQQTAPETPPAGTDVKTDVPAETAATPVSPAKPELATFALRKGRASGGGKRRPPKPELLTAEEIKERQERRERSKKKNDDDRPNKKPFKKKFDKGRDRDDRQDRVFAVAKAQPESSPFAALQGLKVKTGDGQK